MYYQDLIGQRIGSWTILNVANHGSDVKTKMICKCDCGTVREVDAYSLKHHLTKSCGSCKKIFQEGDHMRCVMKNGTSFIFDKDDLQLVRNHSWSLAHGHVRTVIDGKSCYLHRLIMNAINGQEVDHANMDRLDNRRCNLRIATHAENNQNKGLRSDNTTGFKGVCFDKRSGQYIAYINAHCIRTYLGYFNSRVQAAEAYDFAAEKLHGEFAKPNFGEGGCYEQVLEVGA